MPELLGGRQPLGVGVDVVDVGSQRHREGRRVQPDRQPADHQHAAFVGIEAGKLPREGPDGPPGVGNVVRKRRDGNGIDGVGNRDQHRVGVGDEHQIGHETPAIQAGNRRHPVGRHQRHGAT